MDKIRLLAATWMDLDILILSQTEKTNIMWYHFHVESKKWHKSKLLWNRNRLTDLRNRPMVAKAEWGGKGMEWEFGISRCKLLYAGWINNKVLLYSTGNYIQYSVINRNLEKNMKKNTYKTESLYCMAKISIINQLYFNKNF